MIAALFPVAPPETILVVDNFVVGTRRGGVWFTPPKDFADRHRPVPFRRFGLGTAPKGTVTWGFARDEVGDGTYVETGSTLGKGDPSVAGAVPRAPRKVTSLNPKDVVYAKAVRAFLAKKGIVVTPQIRSIHRTDLDGDGTAEVLIHATSLDVGVPDAPANSYSLVLLRALRNGRVVETALEWSGGPKGGMVEVKRLRGIADLDGDGRMEILTTGIGYEWNNATLWGYRAGTVRKLLTNGAGV